MSSESPGGMFSPNDFYERLIVLRGTDPEAFMRFSGATIAALQTYEEAKKKAEEGGKG